ncbi:GAF domain-containing sensor histidine kinase [Picosynechococcus sp. NKBG15041c]|uniref:GAF domain-containing sensor histidine kinase n=1 Tax=Picosynechococcus sp. NKBG15041c TaxID=1407650 RepID=UPI00041E3501|nr:GAF domain-containing sensor histidine kinase [Picosynechococcus sp. NKBG15041c]
MRIPEPLPHEAERLKSLFQQDLLDSAPEAEFDSIVTLAAQLFGVKITLISLVDDCRQWFKAKVGLNGDETSRDLSFCGHALHGEDIFEVPDARLDERFFDNPFVTGEPHVRFYAGQPIRSPDGYKLGTLCLIDDQPRMLTMPERHSLHLLGQQVEHYIQLRHHIRQQEKRIKLLSAQVQSSNQANALKDQLLAVLSHDLRSPLISFRSVLELFATQNLEPGELEGFIPEICQKFDQTETKVVQVLRWAQQQLHNQGVSLEPLNVEAIARSVLPWCQDCAQRKKINLRVDLTPGLQALGNLELVGVVLRNLLGNAMKYSRQGDQVTLFAYQEGQYVELGVQDTGLGMKPETLKKLRSYTYQASAPGTDNELGTGLGLLLCQTYLNQMGTALDIESRWLEGSSFSFRLAIAPDPSAHLPKGTPCPGN